MGTVFKPLVTRPLPDGAQVVTRAGKPVAVWTDASGKKRQAPVTAGDPPRIRVKAGTYVAKYRDGDHVVRRVSTGCKSLDAARAVLAELEARAEKVRAGIVTQAEANVAEHADTPVVDHVDAYVDALARKRGKGAHRTVAVRHVQNASRTRCGWPSSSAAFAGFETCTAKPSSVGCTGCSNCPMSRCGMPTATSLCRAGRPHAR